MNSGFGNGKYSALKQQIVINESKINELKPFIKCETRLGYDTDFSSKAVFDLHNIKEYAYFTKLTTRIGVRVGLNIYIKSEPEKVKIYLNELLFNTNSRIDIIQIDVRDTNFNPLNIILNGIDIRYNEYQFVCDSFIKLNFLNRFLKENCTFLDQFHIEKRDNNYSKWISQMLDYSLRIDKILIIIDKFIAHAETIDDRIKVQTNIDEIQNFVQNKLTY